MKNFDRFMDDKRAAAEKAPQLVEAMVELTYGCNLRCVHCYNPTHAAKNEMTTGQAFRILDELAAQGTLWVGFTGGELFTRPDAFAILRRARSLGMVINILTNATLINESLAGRIQDLAPYAVEVSIYGATAATYESVTRVPGSFDRFVRGVDLLCERGVSIMLKVVVMTLNYHELEAMRDFARSRGLPHQVALDIHPKVDGSKEPLTYRLGSDQAFELWRRVNGEEERREGPSQGSCGSAGRLFDCQCGKSSAAVTPYGELNLCLSIYEPRYDLLRGSVSEGWRRLVGRVAAARPGPSYECSACEVAERCPRGTSEGWLERGTVDAPCIPYYRDIAERKTEFLTHASIRRR